MTTMDNEHRATFVHALQSEWTKLASLRSTAYTLLAFVVLAVGLSLLISDGSADEYRLAPPVEQADFSPTGVGLFSLLFAQLAIVVLGVLVVTGEYATGMVRPSLTAVPRRGRWLASKAAVFGAVTLAAGWLTGFTMFAGSQAILAGQDVPSDSLGEPGVLRAVLGVGLYLTVLGLLAVAVGTLVRSTAGAISLLVAGVLILPNLAQLLPAALAEQVQRFWPTIAGFQIMAVEPDPAQLAPWPGFAWMCGFVAAMLAVAYAVLRRRDA
jgi:ABC-2 type transport system permease protein